MVEPLKDETSQTFELPVDDIVAILVALESAPRIISHELGRMLGREVPLATYDFPGAHDAIMAQRPAERGATIHKLTLPRRRWVSCYHALVWAPPPRRKDCGHELRMRISVPTC